MTLWLLTLWWKMLMSFLCCHLTFSFSVGVGDYVKRLSQISSFFFYFDPFAKKKVAYTSLSPSHSVSKTHLVLFNCLLLDLRLKWTSAQLVGLQIWRSVVWILLSALPWTDVYCMMGGWEGQPTGDKARHITYPLLLDVSLQLLQENTENKYLRKACVSNSNWPS